MNRYTALGLLAALIVSGCALKPTVEAKERANASVVLRTWPNVAFSEWDANHDGIVSRSEYIAGIGKLFTQLDNNKDGSLDNAKEANGHGWEHFAGHDKNGLISLHQFMEAAKLAFEHADTDLDETLSADEFTRFQAASTLP